MSGQLVALERVLEELNVPKDISTMDNRLRIQKAIYLAQCKGADLGYPFSWYIRGPYSPNLTQDYFALRTISESERAAFEGRKLNEKFRTALNEIQTVMKKPANVPLDDVRWLELLASVHYLRSVSKLSIDDARATINRAKSHVADHFDSAHQKLIESELLK